MKKIILISCVMTLALILGGCEMSSTMENNATQIDDEITNSIGSINEIDIDVSSTNVNIIVEDRGDFKAHLYGKQIGNVKEKLNMSSNGNTLKVSAKMKTGVTIGYANLKLDIHVPKNYKDNVKIDSSSGDINLENMNLNKLFINVSSGNAKLNNINVKSLDYKSPSGDLIGGNINTESTYFSTSSGKINLDKFNGNIKGISSSANVVIVYDKFNNDVNLENSSGNVIVNLSKDAEFSLASKSSSGNINCTFPIKSDGSNKKHEFNGTVGSGKNNIKIKTSSGNIDIK